MERLSERVDPAAQLLSREPRNPRADGSNDDKTPEYDWASSFSEGLAVVKLSEKYGYIDKTGKVAIGPRFDDAESFSEGLAVVKLGGRYGYVDKTGKIVIEPRFLTATEFLNGLASVDEEGKGGYIDKSGKYIWIE